MSFGKHGREALKGEFTSTRCIHAIAREFCVEPIAWGTLASDGEAHFYLSKFYNFRGSGRDHMPDPEVFCRQLASLHKRSKSPTGQFGFECVTYNGDIPQYTTWHDRWEIAFTNGLRHVLQVRKERVGPQPAELKKLLEPLFDVVIPRLLRPLESHGRSVKPSLVHGDLWCGNVGVLEEDSTKPMIYDPASFYSHRECTRCSCFKLFLLRPWLTYPGLQMSLGTGTQRETCLMSPISEPTPPISSHPSRNATSEVGSCSIPCECTNPKWLSRTCR